MGRILQITLTSSTCCRLHSRAAWTGLFTAALLRNFRLVVVVGASVDSSVLAFSSTSLLIMVGEEGVPILAMALLGLFLMQVFTNAATKTCLVKTHDQSYIS